LAAQRQALEREGISLLQLLLEEQQQLTAVERFAEHHDAGQRPEQERYYRELLPAKPPSAGEQYGFEVDLDRCTGCKSCVAACSSMNGLHEGEAWRAVGVLVDEAGESPFQHTVTSSCHHCVEPGCLLGCPVMAYEKDEATGIVLHLDDQCIGCQYCVLKCPYGAPQYNQDLGIVRKCDMCHDRLAEAEAPACVQACPTQAIRITTVSRDDVVAASARGEFLPGAPEPGYTQPTTQYKTTRERPSELVPGDINQLKRDHGHLPLVGMLVLTQLSVGVLSIAALLQFALEDAGMAVLIPALSSIALAAGLVGLGSSTAHLGRPQFAYRAILGIRTSWMSREIAAFGLFTGIAAANATVQLAPTILPAIGLENPSALQAAGPASLLLAASAASGILGVFCSAMIYVDTHREFWSARRTGIRFALTSLVLGLSAVITLMSTLPLLPISSAVDPLRASPLGPLGALAGWILLVLSTLKLASDASIFRHLQTGKPSTLKRTALLMLGDLRSVTLTRFAVGFLGTLLVPFAAIGAESGSNSLAPAIAATVGFGCLMLGELVERYIFFSASIAPKMPGAQIQ